jgi:hypothetical protein
VIASGASTPKKSAAAMNAALGRSSQYGSDLRPKYGVDQTGDRST